MNTLTRRKFLKLTAGSAAVGAAAPLLNIANIAEAAIAALFLRVPPFL